jgi:hypothetical protein
LADNLAQLPLPEGSMVNDLPSGGRWVWWSPTLLALLVAALWGVGAFIRHERRLVKDSPDFKTALAAVRPLLEAANPTPRAIKRYQNRMRYLAERLRPQPYEPDAIDTFLHWVGGRIGRGIVPDAWFDTSLQTRISEPALILLGAIEVFAPQAFEQPAEKVLEWLDGAEDGDARAQRRAQLWREVKADFARRFPEDRDSRAWPGVEDIHLYQTFVQSGGRTEVVRQTPPAPPGRPPRSKPVVVAQNPN